jgi:uncharacterized protein YdhG (YjbR/CyaY superfamily)
MKKKKTPATVADYIESYPAPVRDILKKLRAVIRTAAPQAVEKIGYGMPGYYLNGPLVYFAAHTAHIGFYALPGAIKAFAKELAGYRTSKGAIQFPLDRPLPVGLVRKMIAFRIAEKAARKKTARKA